MKRLTRVGFLISLLAILALGVGFGAHAQTHTWRRVTVDAAADVGRGSSIAVDANGDLMISYRDDTNEDLKFAICDLSESANGNCDQTGDWSTVTVDGMGSVGNETFSAIAVDANGDPMISYYVGSPDQDLKFATCDRSASTNGNCDQAGDWDTVAVDTGNAGYFASIAVDSNGDPMISYKENSSSPPTASGLEFAICDLSASTNGNCDQTGDWDTVSVESGFNAFIGLSTSIAVDTNGDPVISSSLFPGLQYQLRFAICDLSASTNGNCDQTGDWDTLTVDGASMTSIEADANGDPMISYYGFASADLKFAICDLSASTNGNCDQAGDWSTVTVDATGSVGQDPSIAVDTNGDPIISYHDYTNSDLKFAICDLSESTNGNCDQTGDWSTQTVDATGDVGHWTDIASDVDGHPVISYRDETNGALKFAIRLPSAPVGGTAELPDVAQGDPWGRMHIAPAALAAAALLALTAGVWYVRRRLLS